MDRTLTQPPPRTPRTEVRHELVPVFSAGQRLGGDPVEVGTAPVALGRAVEQGLCFADDRAASRHHATVRGDRGRVWVHDEDSRNGTRLNGAPVERARLADGDVVRLGESLVVYRTRPRDAADADVPEIVGASAAAAALRVQLAELGPRRTRLVLQGETGVGKGHAARALHRLSGRRRLVHVNCAAVPEALFESQFFGHVQGAFTGATRSSPGFFEQADRGTLFLDEIGELPAGLQAKLLVALDDGAVQAIGSGTPRSVDVRLVVASNVDLTTAVDQGTFRADLWARIAEVELEIPPLRQRREDVLALLELPPELPPLSADLAEALVLHPWPFNVRELQRVAGELAARAPAGDAPLGLELVHRRLQSVSPDRAPRDSGPPSRDRLITLLEEHGGVVSAVAKATGRSTKQVYRWLHRHALSPDDYR